MNEGLLQHFIGMYNIHCKFYKAQCRIQGNNKKVYFSSAVEYILRWKVYEQKK